MVFCGAQHLQRTTAMCTLDCDFRTNVSREPLLEVETDGSLCLTLAIHGDGASVRPDEVLQELVGDRRSLLRLSREELLVDWNGRLVDPMLAASASCRVGAA